jgi:hypothetical protein
LEPNPETELPTTDDAEATTPGGGRRQPCPCGSGKKLKNCCGDVATGLSRQAETSAAPKRAPAPRPGGAPSKHFPLQQQKSIPTQRKSSHTRRV